MDELHRRLAPLRTQIDALDQQLLTLLNARAQLALEVGEVKKDLHAPIFRPEREVQVIRQLQQSNPGPLLNDNLAAIWREIMSASRALEKSLTIAYLGPAGTFSELATQTHFGQAIAGLPCPSIDDVFRAVEAGSADYGVAPVENSTEGAVSRTLDLLLHSDLSISGEISLPIHHHLLTRDGDMSGITSIRAHAQALAQCQNWLSAHYPKIAREAVASNAEAARLAQQDACIAAIAGDPAALAYGLQVTHARIQDDPRNRTRFVVIGRQQCLPSGHDQTSLILSVSNEAGAVYRMLAPLAEHGVSMCRFESRPARSDGWEYVFYVDLEGHQQDANVAAALAELRKQAAFCKILGSYPRSQ